MGSNKYLLIKQMSAKLATLLCLISCRRVSDVRALYLTIRVFTMKGVTCHLSRRPKCNSKLVYYPAFHNACKLCVLRALKAYEDATVDIRPQGVRQLHIALTKPHGTVSSPKIVRWVCWPMQETGIDTSQFGADSVHGSMKWKAFSLGACLEDIK